MTESQIDTQKSQQEKKENENIQKTNGKMQETRTLPHVTFAQALAYGALEAGVDVAVGFPGEPADQILLAIRDLTNEGLGRTPYMEWATNEKVAMEIALGASMSRARSLVPFKYTGVNIAADSFMTGCYAGALGGIVIISVDDPGMKYSQTEQDNRFFGLHGLVPIWEPKSIQEAKDMLRDAFDFSEKEETLVLFRLTSEQFDWEGALKVSLGKINIEAAANKEFRFDEKQRARWTHLPTNARVNRVKLLEREKKISEIASSFQYNNLVENKGSSLGIISSGAAFNKVEESIKELNVIPLVSTLNLGMSYPLSEKLILSFIEAHQKILVVEEIEPILERLLKAIANKNLIKVSIHGKDILPRKGKLTKDAIEEAISQLLKIKNKKSKDKATKERKHKSTSVRNKTRGNNKQIDIDVMEKKEYQQIVKAIHNIETKTKTRFIHTSDFDPNLLNIVNNKNNSSYVDTYIARGGSVGVANGIAKLDRRPVFSYMTPESFYHSGHFGIINAVYNQNDMIIVIFGNPDEYSSWNFPTNPPRSPVNFVEFMQGIGIQKENVFQPSIDSISELENAIESAVKSKGIRVIIPKYNNSNKKNNELIMENNKEETKKDIEKNTKKDTTSKSNGKIKGGKGD